MQLHRNNLLTAILILGCATAQAVYAQDSQVAGVIIEDVRIFDGRSDRLSAPSNVLVVGNVIRTISSTPIADVAGMKVQRIRGGGPTCWPVRRPKPPSCAVSPRCAIWADRHSA